MTGLVQPVCQFRTQPSTTHNNCFHTSFFPPSSTR